MARKTVHSGEVALASSETAPKIRFRATLFRPKSAEKAVAWTFLNLPKMASAELPSRGLVSVEGTFSGVAFQATLEPDGQGGHWLRVEQKLQEEAGVKVGEVVTLEIAPVEVQPEPYVPEDLGRALAASPAAAQRVWSEITPAARRDWIHWIVSPKQEATRLRRIDTACDMLAKGKRRPCCFDRSGIYSKSLSCPVADELV